MVLLNESKERWTKITVTVDEVSVPDVGWHVSHLSSPQRCNPVSSCHIFTISRKLNRLFSITHCIIQTVTVILAPNAPNSGLICDIYEEENYNLSHNGLLVSVRHHNTFISLLKHNFNNDDEINKEKIKGFSLVLWHGCFCFIVDHLWSWVLTSHHNFLGEFNMSLGWDPKLCTAYKHGISLWISPRLVSCETSSTSWLFFCHYR